MKTYKAIIFDFDRTIADSEKAVLFCFDLTLRHFGYPPLDPAAFKPNIGMPMEIQLKALTGEQDLIRIQTMLDWHRGIIHKYMSDMTGFFPYVREGLEKLQKAGIRTGIVSNKSCELMRIPLERDGILPFVDRLIGAEQVSSPKPDPEGLLRMIREFALEKSETIYVGDSLVDQATAQNCGVDFAAMLLGGTEKREFEHGGGFVAVFNCFKDLLEALEPPAVHQI